MFLFEAQRFRAYPIEVLASVVSRLAEMTMYATFWLVVGQFSQSGNINGRDIIAYYLIISGLIPFFSSGFGVASMAIEFIKSGQLSQTLVRPINPILYPWAMRHGRNMFNMILGVIQIVIGLILSGGIKAAALPFLVPVLLNAFFINAALNLLLSASAFYLIEARGLKNTMLHIAAFARGEKMPLFLMPAGLAGFLQLTPFPASQYHLTVLLQGTHLPSWGDVLIGCAWSAALIWIAVKVWKRGLRNYEATGL